ncbi:MAG: FkbM family methyltransferase [Minisyncoccia bacterium]|jgi:FkbM family methyltransferase
MPWDESLKKITESASLFGDISVLDQYCAREFIKKGDVVIEGGANMGVFSCLAASLGATVYAFEPYKKAFFILSKKNQRFSSIIPVHSALGDRNGTAMLKEGGERHFGCSTMTDTSLNPLGFSWEPECQVSEVPITTVDDFVNKNGIRKVDFVKLDIEGYEAQTLRGALKTIKRDRPVIAMSAYHHPEDKKVLPEILHSVVPDYVCRLEKRAEDDFICYVP